jgi:prenylcysteine oxidase/farnesylcysteine lyase
MWHCKCYCTTYSIREETIRIDWPAYPHYHAPEDFAPIILDGKHLYYVNSFESAASAMETGAVAAENVARLIISRLPLGLRAGLSSAVSELHIKSFSGEQDSGRVDL